MVKTKSASTIVLNIELLVYFKAIKKYNMNFRGHNNDTMMLIA